MGTFSYSPPPPPPRPHFYHLSSGIITPTPHRPAPHPPSPGPCLDEKVCAAEVWVQLGVTHSEVTTAPISAAHAYSSCACCLSPLLGSFDWVSPGRCSCGFVPGKQNCSQPEDALEARWRSGWAAPPCPSLSPGTPSPKGSFPVPRSCPLSLHFCPDEPGTRLFNSSRPCCSKTQQI